MKRKIIMFTLLIVILTTVNIVLAKNKTKVIGNTEISIAKPILEIENISQNNLIITEETKNLDYYFRVKNYDINNQVSDISQKYTIEIQTKNNDSINHIKYNLYSTNEERTNENQLNLENNRTDEINIDGVIGSEDYYKIHIDSVEHDCNIQDEIQIKIESYSNRI
ncbi:MAG: hypothetical protein IKG14_03615 [Clostridia bacterium]|nr:hypothetical protein [Clostridia bacterium]